MISSSHVHEQDTSNERLSGEVCKIRRNPRACDACSRRSVRCQPAADSQACQNCVDFGERCTYDRPVRRRGKRGKSIAVLSATPLTSTEISGTSNSIICDARGDQESRKWSPKLAITQSLVMDLTDIFFEVVYPIFPFFHRASILRKVSRGEHMTDRPLYASVMAMCALSSARARDGALFRHSWDMIKTHSPTSEELFEAAVHTIPTEPLDDQLLGYMRASVLLAITAIQYGSPRLMNLHLSTYHAYVAIGSLHDEAHWPQGLSLIEIEERRRLFWSAYTLDVFTSVVWGGTVRSREASSNVCYPTEADDDTMEAFGHSTHQSNFHWIHGWNFVTDMYRMLEYATSDIQRLRASTWRTPTIPSLQGYSTPTNPAMILDRMTVMYADLPPIFKATLQPTNDDRQNLYSFQAANIAATIQLVRMVYFSSDASTLEQKCCVASEVLTAFADMPEAYLRAISSPLLHHLAEIGKILGAALGAGMSQLLYRSVRAVLLDLAAFLASLETNMYCPTDASKKVELQVVRMDRFIEGQHHAPASDDKASPLDERRYCTSMAEGGLLPIATMSSGQSPELTFPPELLEGWSGVFNFV